MIPTARRTLTRTTLRFSALSSGPVIGGSTFAFALSSGASAGVAALLGVGFLLFGLASWAILDAIYRFTDKLEVATSDPFGLQYQEKAWWAASTPQRSDVYDRPQVVFDDGDDWT